MTHFVVHLSITIDLYSSKYDRIVVTGDFNQDPLIKTLCHGHDLHNLIKENTCLGNQNCKFNFQSTVELTSGFSDFHKITATVLTTEYIKADPIQVNYRNYTKFNPILFQEELRDRLYQDTESMSNFSNVQETYVWYSTNIPN